MGLLTKLKSLLGLEDDRSQVRRGESGVTIEREPDEPVEPDAGTESAVKGVDTGTGEAATDESGGLDEIVEAEPESAEATEPATDAEAETLIDEAEETEVEETTEKPEIEIAEAEEPETEEPEDEEAEAEEPEAEEAETEADEPADEGEPLEKVKGIGSAYAERLRDAGVANVAELAASDPDALAEETDISAKRISTWVDRANAR